MKKYFCILKRNMLTVKLRPMLKCLTRFGATKADFGNFPKMIPSASPWKLEGPMRTLEGPFRDPVGIPKGFFKEPATGASLARRKFLAEI